MATQITLTTGFTREALVALRAEIDAVLGLQEAAAEKRVEDEASYNGALYPLAVQLRDSIGERLRTFVEFYLINRDPGTEFTLDDVAREMGVAVGTVRAWHRSLSKPLNRITKQNPGVPEVTPAQTYGGQWHFTVDPEWRTALKLAWKK